MLLLLAIFGVFVLVMGASEAIKDAHTNAKHRWEDKVMADYLRAEGERYHRQRLAAIDAAVQATSEEMARIAAEARGEIIEGRCQEIEPR
jgi:hypothetical protein